jgi:FAD/FMN-containing dehydrogenase/Fe-S oxidoreductase
MFKRQRSGDGSPDLIRALNVAGLEYALDHSTRLLYSTDASIYQIMPVGVVWPRNGDQVSAAVELAQKLNLPVLPRGAGTSLAGQAIGNALILDFSRFMDRTLEINREERFARVEPGVVLGALNRQLKTIGLTFGPDPASADRATVGGVLGNNATGAHSILYGMTHDHILETETVLSDGSQVTFQAADKNQLASLRKKNTLEGSIYRQLPALIDRYRDDIARHFPKTFRNVAGYNLNVLARQKRINPAALLVGSEGTLGIVTAAKLGLVPLPPYQALYLIHFSDLKAALEAAPAILETEPSAIELIDRMLLDLARATPGYHTLLDAIQGTPEAVLAVEYQGNDLQQLSSKKSLLSVYGETVPLLDPKEQSRIWKARKVGLGILQSQPGDAKATAFIEDAAVPVEHLSAYALEIKRFAAEIGVGAIAFYAHASAGCLHIRPQVNLKSTAGLEQMRLLAEKSLQLVKQYGGTTSGEHGEGIVRGEFSKQLFGPDLTRAFKETKEIFDPDYRLNPGKIVDPPSMDRADLLRYGPRYQALYQPQQTLLSFEAEGGFDRAVEMCNGAGVCRQLEEGVMCPSYKATRDERYSTRGRSNLLRAAISGKLGPGGLTSEELYQALDLCLSCQACGNECPSSVNMSKLKAEFLFQYYQKNGTPFRSWFFAHIADISRLAQPFAPLVNPLLGSPLGRTLTLIGIHPQRQMPAFARETFSSWHRKQAEWEDDELSKGVVFFHDTYLEYNYPHIGQAVCQIFQKAGIKLIVLPERVDSGRPAYSKGLLDTARQLARKNLEILAPFAEQGLPIISCEPSDLAMLKNEYRDLVPGSLAELVAAAAIPPELYLLEEIKKGRIKLEFDSRPRRVLYHGHCQQKAHFGTAATLGLLRSIPNCQVEEIEAGCCGMAGAFGYEKEHYQLSLEIAELGLAPRVRQADADTIICASGTSCREQIIHTTSREPVHPLEVFAGALI